MCIRDSSLYGGKGINVCEAWSEYEQFRSWSLENGYNDSLTLDRIDGDKGYTPENCRWVSMKVQQNNRCNNHLLTFNGETLTLSLIHIYNWTLSASCDVIARQYDNNSRALYVVGELPEGYEWDMLVSVEDNLNIIRLSPMDEGIGAVLTDDQLAFGNVAYTMQLRGTQGDVVRHTNKIYPYIPDSLSGDAQWPTIPSEFSDYEKRLEELNDHPPMPGDNGFWLIWNTDTHEYEESDVPLPSGTGSVSYTHLDVYKRQRRRYCKCL